MARRKIKRPTIRKRLTLDDRIKIEGMLNKGDSISDIAYALQRPYSTIMREIKNHTIFISRTGNDCSKQTTECLKKHRCGNNECTRNCRYCFECIKYCNKYEPYVCTAKITPPYVCNACNRFNFCRYEKKAYRASNAQEEYKETLSDNRSGFMISKEKLDAIDKIVSPLLKQGLSPYHICNAHPELDISEATLRRMINNSVLDGRNIDLRNQVKRKQRRLPQERTNPKTIHTIKEGHTYKDFLEFQAKNDYPVVEMDCVEGKATDVSVLLTLHFKHCHFQLAFIMDFHNAKYVVKTLDNIEEQLGKELFSMMFPIILTDNGKEFTDIEGMERSIFGGKRTRIYFCEPRHSEQKGSCEKNHTLIRYVIPKGASLEEYLQCEITLMMNHINSYARKALYGKCPFDLAEQLYPQEFFDKLGLVRIPPDEILLKPQLLLSLLSK